MVEHQPGRGLQDYFTQEQVLGHSATAKDIDHDKTLKLMAVKESRRIGSVTSISQIYRLPVKTTRQDYPSKHRHKQLVDHHTYTNGKWTTSKPEQHLSKDL
jgi:hypothetical protein